MRRRREAQRRVRDAALASALEQLRPRALAEARNRAERACGGKEGRGGDLVSWTWEDVPCSLDPWSKELTKMTKIGRAERKRQQLEAMAAQIASIFTKGDTIVDFGCGQGHLGMLLAYLHPSSRVILVDNNPEKLAMASAKLDNLSESMQARVTMVDSIDKLRSINFDIGVGLHCCGKLTDMSIECAVVAGASFCISPCCYGQVGTSTSDDLWKAIARGADYNAGAAHLFDPSCDTFKTAKTCMNLIDMELRGEKLANEYCVTLSSMMPLTCSPKNNILCGVPVLRAASPSKDFQSKVVRVRQDFAGLVSDKVLRSMTLIPSPSPHYRLRCRFALSADSDGNCRHFVYEGGSARMVSSYPIASPSIAKAMPVLEVLLTKCSVLRANAEAVHYLTSLSGNMLVTLIYSAPIGSSEWRRAACQFQAELRSELSSKRVMIMGRSRKQRVVVDCDYINEMLVLDDGRVLRYMQCEGSFSNPNGRVNERVLDWLVFQTSRLCMKMQGSAGTSLLELYCGNCNHTVALASQYDHVVAVEIDKRLCTVARDNCARNGITNVTVHQMPSEKFWVRCENKSVRASPDLSQGKRFSTILVDPPRAGLDHVTLAACSNFPSILYISCKAESLHRDLAVLTHSHDVVAMGIFDQFARTSHIECAVALVVRECSAEG